MTKYTNHSNLSCSQKDKQTEQCQLHKSGSMGNMELKGHLESEGLSSSSNNGALNISRSNKVVRVRHLGQGAFLSGILRITEIIVSCNSIAFIGRVQSLLGVDKCIGLDQHLRTQASVNGVTDFFEVAVVDVAGSEAEGWRARVDVVPEVVVLGNAEVALVFVSVAVRVADQRCLPVVVEEGVGDGDKVRGVGELSCLLLAIRFGLTHRFTYINETVIVVLIMVTVGRDVTVVNPDIVRVF